MHRVEGLANRGEGYVDVGSPSFKKVVPLVEIIGNAFDVGSGSIKVEREYFRLIKNFGTEFKILLEMAEGELKDNLPDRIARGIINVRRGNVKISPGYDGEYGTVKTLGEADAGEDKQLRFF